MQNKIYSVSKTSSDNTYNIATAFPIRQSIILRKSRANVLENTIVTPLSIDDDFELLEPFLYDGDTIEESYKIWTIDFEFMPEIWLHGIQPVILKKYGEDSTGELDEDSDVKEGFILGLEDISFTTYAKKVKLSVGYTIRNRSGVQDDIYLKLLLNIPVPIINK